MPMKNPPHPGLSVRHDCLEPLGLSVTEAARRLGVSRKQLSNIVNGRSGISAEMAIRLDMAFGGGAETWHQMQAAYDLRMPSAGRHTSKSSASCMRLLGEHLQATYPRPQRSRKLSRSCTGISFGAPAVKGIPTGVLKGCWSAGR